VNVDNQVPGRVLAIDYGTVRLGLAISDARQQFASPYANYTRVNSDRDLRYLRRVLQEEQVAQIVVGLPIHLDGRESQKSAEARQFAAWLQGETGIAVALHDERFTSVEAESHLLAARLTKKRRKARLDMLAAQLLLTAYLESDRTRSSPPPRALDDPRSAD
jgi:putative Holliday junction resolvase